MKKHNQNGFGLMEGLLIVLILAVVGFGSYTVWHNQKKTTNTTSSSSAPTKSPTSNSALTTSLKLASGTVGVSLPEGWTSVDYSDSAPTPHKCYTTVYSTDNIKCIEGKTIYLTTKGQENGPAVYFSVYQGVAGHTDPKTWFCDLEGCSQPQVTESSDIMNSNKINGYDAFYWEQNNGSNYTDENFVISNGSKVAFFYARMMNGASQDYTTYTPQLRQIVDSISIQ